MKNKIVKYSVIACVCALAIFTVFSMVQPPLTSANASTAQELARENIVVKKANGEELIFSVEMALSGGEQARGLMHRTNMEENHGMLFLFSGVSKRSFWMKNTLIPLDIIFLREDGSIHHIHHMAKPLDKTLVTSIEGSKAVLEINGGLSDQMGIQVGDKVYHNAFRNMNLLAE